MSEINLFNYIVTLLQFGMMYAAFDYILTRRCNLAVIAIADFAAINASFFVLILFFERYTVLRSLMGWVFFLLPLLLYSDKWYKKLLVFLCAMCAMCIAEYAVCSFDSGEILMSGVSNMPMYVKLPHYIIYLSGFGMLLVIMCMAAKHLSKKCASYLQPFEFLTMCAFLISQYILTIGRVSSLATMTKQKATFLIIAVIFGIISDVGLFITLVRISQRSKLSAENAYLKQLIDAQKEYYDAIAEQAGSIRKMRHDIANHLLTIDILLAEGNTEKVREYTQELQQAGIYQSTLGKCQNIAADAFLTARSHRLRDAGITLDADIELPADLNIRDADLISALGNLLDNAEEACRNVEDKHISLSAKLNGEYLVITTENPCSDIAQPKVRRIPEMERGVGFHIMQELAEKYDGEFEYKNNNNVFCVSLILKTGESSHA